MISDALSRLQVSRTIDEMMSVLKSFYVSIKSSNRYKIAYHVTLIEMSNDFKSSLKEVYADDKQWAKILKLMSNSDYAKNKSNQKIVARFLLRNDLLYYVADDNRERLCLSEFMKREIFDQAHD